MYRLFIPEVMPDVKNVIYFDCDILVNMDIAELWALEETSSLLLLTGSLRGEAWLWHRIRTHSTQYFTEIYSL